jgi:capsular exopolysaccharide synthesis family protein
MELNVYFKPLRRWWWLLLASTLLAAGSSYWYVKQQPSLYEATTTLMIGQGFEDPNPTGMEFALSQQLTETYADLVQRRPVREQTMAALGLDDLPTYSAQPLPNRQLLEIIVVDPDPQLAKAVADELANQLILQSPTAPRPEDQEREAFVDEQLASLQTNIRQTESDIAAKRVELESAFSALEIRDLQNELAALQTKLDTLQSNYAALLANTSEGAVNTVTVIEPATLPLTPNDSEKPLLVLSASALALGLAVATAYLLEYLDNTVRTPEDVEFAAGVTHLPGIPKFPADSSKIPVLAPDGSLSPITDAFRALRTGLYAAIANKPGKIFLITSAAPKEGKSIIAANLAAVLAEGGKRVRLVDADLRRPRQHKLFEVAGEPGLAELLISLEGHDRSNGSGEMIERVTQKLKPANLGLITAGSNLVEGARLLGSDTMKMLLQTISQHVDYVIIDSPPLLAVADPFMLSTQVDGVILVASASSIPRKQVEQALHRLGEANANVVGVVLNHQEASVDGYQYYQYYRVYTEAGSKN